MKTQIKRRSIERTLLGGIALAGLAMGSSSFAAVGGGATIHNAASLTFSGGQVTSSVNVVVATIGSQPIIALVPGSGGDVNSGDAVSVDYTITSTGNGTDNYNLTGATTDTGVSAPTGLTITTPVTLGASIVLGSAANEVSIPAGSETGLVSGDIVTLETTGGTFLYVVGTVTPGTVASTTGNTTTPEVNSTIALTPAPASGAPILDGSNVTAGAQLGEQQIVSVDFTAGSPNTPGTDGTHQITIGGSTTAVDGTGSTVAITFTDPTPAITVLSGDATLVKEVSNETAATGVFATSGISGRTGDTLRYRLTVGTVAGESVTGANLQDSIPAYTTYVAGTTTLNGAAAADVSGDSPLVAGMDVNSAGAATGTIVDGETAVVTFDVTVD